MKTLTTLLLGILGITFITGCSEDTTSPTSYTIKDVFPMASGNSWAYIWTKYDTDGSISKETSTKITTDSAGNVNGISGFYGTSDDENKFYYYTANDARVIDYPSSGNRSILIAHYPMNINEIITVRDTTYIDGSRSRQTMRLVADKVSITVPAGPFSCLEYETVSFSGVDDKLDTSGIETSFFSFGVGLVESTYYTYFPDTVKRLYHSFKLSSYTIK